MTKDSCNSQEWICENCEPEKHEKASDKLGSETHEALKVLIESILFSKSGGLHHTDKQDITTDVLLRFAIMEQIFNRKFVYNHPVIDKEMVECMRAQYHFHLDNCLDAINQKDKDLNLYSTRTPERSEVN
tara:strand:+ start:964 stop:1353 length:390 start_codon:yes stop_codon:yes gene_type:complete